MTEYKCGSCKEVFIGSPKAKFCPECGSSSLNLVIKELTEPAQKETVGVYSPPDFNPGTIEIAEVTREEEDQPRRRRR